MAKNHPRVCLACNKPFIAKNLRGAYCSAKCKVSHSRKKKRNVTQNAAIAPCAENIELKEMMALIEKEEHELINLQNKIEGIKTTSKERAVVRQKFESEEKKLLEQRNTYVRLNGTIKSGGNLARLGFQSSEDNINKLLYAIIGGRFDNALNQPCVYFNYTSEIKNIDIQLALIRKNRFIPLVAMDVFQQSDYERKAELKIKKIENMKSECKKLEEDLSKRSIIKSLDELKDIDGFVSAKDVKNISFEERITLNGDIGQFIGALERDKCAITLTGKQGSGKTFLSFDLISKFIEKKLTVAYFSCEEGINQLTREKLIHYHLDNTDSLKIKEQANLEDIQRAANTFDVVVIDSWGKLNADISEFDKLRHNFPKTIIVAIFQLTSSGQMRGGTMAAFDAGINIETSIEQGKRIAVCKKNRYGKTGVRYFIDPMKIELPL